MLEGLNGMCVKHYSTLTCSLTNVSSFKTMASKECETISFLVCRFSVHESSLQILLQY